MYRALKFQLLREFGGMGGGEGDGDRGNTTKVQESTSQTKDNSATAGGDNIGAGGEGNVTIVGSDDVARRALDFGESTVDAIKDLFTAGFGGMAESRGADAEIARVYAESNLQASNGAVQRIAELAETKITDGANLNQKTTVIALAIGGAVLLLSALKRNK